MTGYVIYTKKNMTGYVIYADPVSEILWDFLRGLPERGLPLRGVRGSVSSQPSDRHTVRCFWFFGGLAQTGQFAYCEQFALAIGSDRIGLPL